MVAIWGGVDLDVWPQRGVSSVVAFPTASLRVCTSTGELVKGCGRERENQQRLFHFVDKTGKRRRKIVRAKRELPLQTVPAFEFFCFFFFLSSLRVAHSRDHGSSLACWLYALITLHSIAVLSNLSALPFRVPRSLSILTVTVAIPIDRREFSVFESPFLFWLSLSVDGKKGGEIQQCLECAAAAALYVASVSLRALPVRKESERIRVAHSTHSIAFAHHVQQRK